VVIKYTKWSKYIPNGHKIYQHLSLQDTPKFTQSLIFGLKIWQPCFESILGMSDIFPADLFPLFPKLLTRPTGFVTLKMNAQLCVYVLFNFWHFRELLAQERCWNIFLGTTYQNGKICTKWTQNIPNSYINYTKWPESMVAIKYLY
jgi:hypothetical protein